MGLFTSDYRAQPAPTSNIGYDDNTNIMLGETDADMRSRILNNENRANQLALIEALKAQSTGNAPSLAAMQMQEGISQAQKGAAGTIGSVKGINPALAAQLTADKEAEIMARGADAGAQLRLKEQMAAREALANALSTTRGQDIQGSTLMNQRLATVGALREGQRGQDINNILEAQRINAGVEAQNAKNTSGIFGGLLSGAGGILGSVIGGGGGGGGGGGIFGGKSNNTTTQGGATGGQGDPSGGWSGGMGEGGGTSYSDPWDSGNSGGGGSGGTDWGGMGYGESYSKGGIIPGKAEVKGDSPKNDKVLIAASPGEVVIPRSIAKDGDKAKEFIEALNKKSGNENTSSYAHVLSNQRRLAERIKRIEAMYCGGMVK